MSTTRTSDCRKFSPNIFNKSKCSHCFRQREEHSAAALECNRASRKISKCGYLFVAPDWDFSNPLYRTKRWQRRWFVLYDDGELTYSVDEHPETVPQACIDMTKVLEVTTAEDVTGHTNSIAITAPDRVTFVKGTCPEESKWWLNILAAFPKSKGRHKRNATFPGGQATTILQTNSIDACTGMGGTTTARNRHNSYHKDALTSAQSTGILIGSSVSVGLGLGVGVGHKHCDDIVVTAADDDAMEDEEDDDDVDVDDDEDDGVETGEDEEDDDEDDGDNTKGSTTKGGQDENNRNAGNEINNRVSPPCLLIEDIRRDEKTIKDIANTITNLSQQHQKQHRWSTSTAVNNALNSHHHHQRSNHHVHQQTGDKNSRDETDFHHRSSTQLQQQQVKLTQQQKSTQQQTTIVNLRPKSLPLASNSTPAIVSAIVKKIPPVLVSSANTANTSTATTNLNCGGGSAGDSNNNNNNSSSNMCKSSPRLQLQLKHLQQKHQSNQNRQQKHLQQQQQQQQQQQAHERGDPDGGCNLDDLSSNYLAKTAELRVNPTAQQKLPSTTTATTTPLLLPPPPPPAVVTVVSATDELLNSKKGWLMKQDNRTGDWTKHWFSLSGAALFYYRDPVSEERGVLDGVLDVNSITNVAEVSANKSYAFQLTTWDKRRLTLAALSPSSRNNWIAILRNVAGLQQQQQQQQQQATTTTQSQQQQQKIQTNNSNSSLANNKIANNSNSTEAKVSSSSSSSELIIKDNTSDDIKSEIEKDFIKAQRNHDFLLQNNNNNSSSNQNIKSESKKTLAELANPQVIITNSSNNNANASNSNSKTIISPMTPSTPKTTHFSSDEEYRTASEGGRRDSIDWGSPLSPSPPIPLSILRTKDRMGSRIANYPHLHKRSRSSPPSSRRSTVDSVGSDEMPIIHPVQEELNIDKELQFRLNVAEKERNILRDEAKEREARMSELLRTLERTEQELNSRIQEMEEVRDNLTTQLEDAKRNAEEIIDRLTDELEESHKKIKDLEDRLARGIDENETLYKRLRELESCSPSSFTSSNLNRSKLKRMDSLSDLTQISDVDPYCLERDSLAEEYNELRSRFEKAVNEIKAMKRELKESQNQFDSLEISYASLKQDLERREIEDRSQLQMMAARIQDLTLKYSSSERQVRLLKQKLAKSERRRSLSLKGKEQLTISKELEVKVFELEAKIDEIEKSTCETKTGSISVSLESTNTKPTSSMKKSSRRRSLESSACADSLQFMVRVNDLEKRFDGITAGTGCSSLSSCSTPTPSAGTPSVDNSSARSSIIIGGNAKMSEHLIERLRCLEGVLIASKDRLEQSLQQLQNLRSSRTRRSVSPITDRKDSYRFVERCLGEVVKLIRESCETCVISGSTAYNAPNVMLLPESSPVKIALTQLEAQLRNKLAELLKQRRMLRERNELTKRKDLELLAERVAFESVCFGKLRDSVARAEHPELFGERQTRAEVAETSHLMTMLKAKLSGKCTIKPSGSLDVLAGVLARRLMLSTYRSKDTQGARTGMEPVDQNILDDLLRQQNEINLIAKRYKNNAMENLATGLAAETLSYISANDLVQGAVQEAWRQAQETVNAELVQSEIAHIMMRNAERFENSITPSFGYTLTEEERLSFEKFADAVHDALRKEMELAVTQLTHCYEEAMQKMKRGQWRLHLEQERKASEGRQLLSEFADIIAHKALVDARIAVLRGEYVTTAASQQCESTKIGITTLQKYENLFEELSNDLQLNNPDDILAEADFEFMYKQHTIDFLNDRQVLSDITTFLGQLEDSLIALQCEAVSTTSISRSAISIESLQDVCHKCCDLRQRADQLLQEVHRKLNTPCQHCLQVREKLCSLQQQHESEILRLQQSNAKDINGLMQQVENQRNALKSLEAEKNAINSDLHKSEELIEERERELVVINNKLRAKEEELMTKQSDQLELLQRLDEQEEKMHAMRMENDALAGKCARQDEEYAVLLQERDYLQAELNKEKERSRRFEKRLEMLELEHSKQVECLQEAYRDQLLSHCAADFTNVDADEESFRQRYQAEIEQLRTLCEKGLSAMESSHRRIVGDLEEKHKSEIERLLVEKETALAEETQATLAALDAMRKAHQSEVQREVARFKQEFLRQLQKGELSHDTAKINEEELEELRQEILSFSEKYSIKCVENAALEEKLRSTSQKLKNFQQMQQLELRNKQFRAHLASENPTTDINFVQGLGTSKDDATCQDSEKPKMHAHVEFITNTNNTNSFDDMKATTTTTISKVVDSPLPQAHLKQSFFVIPSSSLLRPRSHHTKQLQQQQKTVEDSSKNVDDNLILHIANSNNANTTNDNHNNNKQENENEMNDNDAIVDNVINNNDISRYNRYSYEPCYKQSNLYSFQSRMSFEGLKSSTFGKDLKSAIKKTIAITEQHTPTVTTLMTTSPASSSSPTTTTTTAATSTSIATNANANTNTKTNTNTSTTYLLNNMQTKQKMQQFYNNNNNQKQQQQQQLYKTATTININNHNNNNANNFNNNTTNYKAKEQINLQQQQQHNYNYYYYNLQEKQIQNKQQEEHENEKFTNDLTIVTTTTTKPVEQPKNFSANNINININNRNINKNNLNYHEVEEEEEKRGKEEEEEKAEEDENLKLVKLNNKFIIINQQQNNNNNNNSNQQPQPQQQTLVKSINPKAIITTTKPIVERTTTTTATLTITPAVAAAAAATVTPTNLKLAEKSAINLNSFTDIIRKTQQRTQQAATAATTTTNVFVKNAKMKEKQQQQLQQPPIDDDVGDSGNVSSSNENNKSSSSSNTGASRNNNIFYISPISTVVNSTPTTTTTYTPSSRHHHQQHDIKYQYCSPPSNLCGRDVEHFKNNTSSNTTTTTTTNNNK